MNKAIKYRLYPTSEQAEYFLKCFGCCRFVYNQALDWRIKAYNADRTHLNYNGTVLIMDDKHLRLPKAGTVRACIHRMPESGWMIRSTTISMDSDGRFYASVLFEYDHSIVPIPISDNALGLDYKSDGLYMDSEGNSHTGHKYFRDSQVKLASEQRKLKHKTIGSNNYKKQQLRIARIHKHISNQRLDDLHKTSTEIANRYDVVCVEDLNLKSMSNKAFGNGKATMDNGYGMFLNMLEYKLNDRGKYFVKVGKWYPSTQTCCRCGCTHKLGLNERIYRCGCGLTIDRDLNAAINIRNEGLKMLYEQDQKVG